MHFAINIRITYLRKIVLVETKKLPKLHFKNFMSYSSTLVRRPQNKESMLIVILARLLSP